MLKDNITLIGAGNVGYHLGHRLYEKGANIKQVFSRKITKAKNLAKRIDAAPIKDLQAISKTADLYIIAVHDDAIVEVARQISPLVGTALVVHTSGSVSSKILKPYFKNYGCFYPLQSFSIAKKADFDTLPICIYSPQKRNRQGLMRVAKSICPNVYEINDQQKSVLHVAAVFVNNFANHFYHIAHQITEQQNIDFDILKPLILETATKIQDHNPDKMQTGPALRGDEKTMQNHLDFLKQYPDWAHLYELISKSIMK